MGKGDKKLSRLTDMEVVEVSAVDRAANKRTFLVTKAEAGMAKAGDKAGAAVVKDGKGGHTAEKGGAAMKLAKAAKEELLKRAESVIADCAALKAAVEKAEEADGAELPAEVAEKVAGMAETLLGKEGDAVVVKGRKQFSATRLSAIRTAHQQLGQLLNEVDGGESGGDDGGDADAESDALAKLADGFEGLSKKLDAFKDGITAALGKAAMAVKSTAERVGALEEVRQAPNAASRDAVAPVEKKKAPAATRVRWGTDLNRLPTDLLGGEG